MSVELKSCPCCGGKAKLQTIQQSHGKEPGAYVECDACGMQTNIHRCRTAKWAEVAAADNWSTRVQGGEA